MEVRKETSECHIRNKYNLFEGNVDFVLEVESFCGDASLWHPLLDILMFLVSFAYLVKFVSEPIAFAERYSSVDFRPVMSTQDSFVDCNREYTPIWDFIHYSVNANMMVILFIIAIQTLFSIETILALTL